MSQAPPEPLDPSTNTMVRGGLQCSTLFYYKKHGTYDWAIALVKIVALGQGSYVSNTCPLSVKDKVLRSDHEETPLHLDHQ